MYGALTEKFRIPIQKICYTQFSEMSKTYNKTFQLDAGVEEFLTDCIDAPYLHDFLTEINTTELEEVKQLNRNIEILLNHSKINNIRWINKYFIEANNKITKNGVFIGTFESNNQRNARLIKKYSFIPKRIVSLCDFVIFRVIPKLPKLRVLFFHITKGKNRAISLAEMLGRLIYCGFDLVSLKEINNQIYFISIKKREPAKDVEPSYGPLFKMKRAGKDGKIIHVYKLRTMNAYAEYLQKFVHDNLKLKDGGKFNDDFRITGWGKIFRKVWLDELPMLINFLKGEMKLVGVRPISFHYLSLYNQETIEKRCKVKPGLIPPFYADLPKTLDEIQESEIKYLDRYQKNPIKTDFVYFWKALYNIAIKKTRSS